MDKRDWVARLSQLGCLKREVDELSQRIARLETEAMGGVGRITGMPGARRTADRTAEFAVRLAEVRGRMERRRLDCMEELGRLYAFIDDVEYIDGLSWQAIAFRIGETDEQVPRRLHNRLIQQKILENAKFDENDEQSVL